MTARECWFCFVPAMAVLCLGQAAFKPCCSRGSLGKAREKPELEGSLVQQPDPALQSHSSRDEQELGWALPRASTQALFPPARKEKVMEREEMVRK